MLRLVIARPNIAKTISEDSNKLSPQEDKRSLIGQDWSLERIAKESKPPTWEKVWEDSYHELKDVSEILDNQEKTYGQYYPLKKDIFTAFWLTKLSNVKVVILGQDPYHQTISVDGLAVPRAVGLSFSIRREDTIPSSLKNIYTELANTVRGFARPDHGDLTEWAQQGVLLLNKSLTVRANKPDSHGDIWLGFISKVFKAISIVNPYCIFLLWGREAQKIKPMLGERSIILEAAHPSGLSANRGFFGCNHFCEVNKHLLRLGKTAINWKISTLAELENPNAIVPVILPTVNNIEDRFVPVNINQVLNYVPPTKLTTSLTPVIPVISFVQPLPTNNGEDKKRILPMIPNTRNTTVYNIPTVNHISSPKNSVLNNSARPIIPDYGVNK